MKTILLSYCYELMLLIKNFGVKKESNQLYWETSELAVIKETI